ncbi:MAG: undecaprenyl-diphosphatase [Candidatus Tokpelaia sp. JSC161]|nr:MAG: undecaprenyl-diphosphatase [Candidatus Tokpelaia sp. JSC161]
MDLHQILTSLFFGLIEGFTEFIPVSSTGHLILSSYFFHFTSPGNLYQILIQPGALFAIVGVYWSQLLKIAQDFFKKQDVRRFVLSLFIGCLPALIVGFLLHELIKTVFLNSLCLICCSLIFGGIILILVDRLDQTPRYLSARSYPLSLCLKIGLFQCLALIPGISRSGSTIVGALLMGTDKRSAAEFSFFLALPTMIAACSYDLLKNYDKLSHTDELSIMLGFITAFLSGLFVVRRLLDYVSSHGYAVFGWWRIFCGSLGLITFLVFG